MSGWKGGGLLLILAAPLAFYAAWQVKGVVRADMVVSDVPPDRGGTKEQLAATKAKAAAWAGDVRKASGVALQYRQKEAADATGDPVAAEAVSAAAARAANLTDLDLFLNDVKKPEFIGKLKGNYVDWKQEADQTHATGRALADWLARPVAVNAAADADGRMRELEGLIGDYLKTGFARPDLAAQSRVRGRLKVVEQLAARADNDYPNALKVPLPLKSGDNDLKSTLATLVALKAQVAALAGDVEQAGTDKADLAAYRADIERLKSAAAKAGSREKLLALFAQDKLFTDPTGATAWLQDVAALYRQATFEDKRQIRKKVQEFCEAFIPAVARLDDRVLIGTASLPRDMVQIKYRKDGKNTTAPLSADPTGLTEFNVTMTYPKDTTFVLSPSEGYLETLKPTELSVVADFYNKVRRAVPPGAGGLKWTAKTVEDLKNKCEKERKMVDQLKLLRKKDETAPDDEAKIFARLEGLLEGLKANPELVESAP